MPLLTASQAPTLGAAFNSRRNSLNFLRVVFATGVIISHAWPLGGFGADPSLGGMDLGDWAVGGFFAISGWLILSSRLRSNGLSFFVRRTLRIYPGFLVAITLVAFLFAPIAGATGPGTYNIADAIAYIRNNVMLVVLQPAIGDTLASVPYPNVWNGVLWTLFYEFLCYLAISAMVSIFRRKLVVAVAGTWLACTAATASFSTFFVMDSTVMTNSSRLGCFFFSGALLYLLRNQVRLSVPWLAGSLLLLVLAAITGSGAFMGSIPVAYICFFVATTFRANKFGRKNDLSYGIYIYAFPVQQMLALHGFSDFGIVVYIVASVVCTIPLAYGSWILIERRAMSLGMKLSGGT